MLSHLLPYLLYVVPAAAAGVAPEPLRPWLDPLRVVLAGAALVVFARRGAYPEIRGAGGLRPALLAAGVACGVAVAFLWMPLSQAVPSFGSRGGFDPAAAGPGAVPWLWAARWTGFVLVVPFAEELLVRSLLPRFVDAPDVWRSRGVGTFTAVSAGVSVAFFTFSHPEWLAALVTAVLWTVLVARSRRLGDAIVAHAVANLILGVRWAASGDLSWW